MPHDPPRKNFDMDQFSTTVDAQVRQARALEYSAYYLDRIEGHLERIANSLADGGRLTQSRASAGQGGPEDLVDDPDRKRPV